MYIVGNFCFSNQVAHNTWTQAAQLTVYVCMYIHMYSYVRETPMYICTCAGVYVCTYMYYVQYVYDIISSLD